MNRTDHKLSSFQAGSANSRSFASLRMTRCIYSLDKLYLYRDDKRHLCHLGKMFPSGDYKVYLCCLDKVHSDDTVYPCCLDKTYLCRDFAGHHAGSHSRCVSSRNN
jgi:hypothetical protein